MGTSSDPRVSSPSMRPGRKVCCTRVLPPVGLSMLLTMARLRPFTRSRTRLTAVFGTSARWWNCAYNNPSATSKASYSSRPEISGCGSLSPGW